MDEIQGLEKISSWGETSWPKMDWEYIFKWAGVDVTPYLEKCEGELATAVSHPENAGLRMVVAHRGGFIFAHPEAGREADAADFYVTEEQIQIWRVDQARVAARLAELRGDKAEGAGAAAGGPGAGNAPVDGRPKAHVLGDFTVVLLPSGRQWVLGGKWKRRAFLKEAAAWCKAHGTDTFFWQQVIEDYSARMTRAGAKHAGIRSDRLIHDLFKHEEDKFAEVFEVVNRAAGQLRFKVSFVYPPEN